MSDGDDSGFMGWKDWKVPRFGTDRNITPVPGIDGSSSGNGYGSDRPVREWPGEYFNPVKYPNMSPSWTMMSLYTTPYITTFFTDIGGGLCFNGAGLPCEKFELQAMECMEFYGTKQGSYACKDAYDDLMECRHKTKQNLRVKHMWRKRGIENHLEYLQGKRTWEETYEAPPKYFAHLNPFQDPKNTQRQGGMTT